MAQWTNKRIIGWSVGLGVVAVLGLFFGLQQTGEKQFVSKSSPSNRMIAQASDFSGKWKGNITYSDGTKHSAKASFYVEGTRIVGFFTAWDNEQLTCQGYIAPDTGKMILKTWYDDRPHDRMELKLSQDGKTLKGGTYQFADKNQEIELTKE